MELEPMRGLLLPKELRWIRLESALEGEDYVALRADPCCHYNAAGHARLADIFERDLVGDVVPEKQP
jgi:hypothetical protein